MGSSSKTRDVRVSERALATQSQPGPRRADERLWKSGTENRPQDSGEAYCESKIPQVTDNSAAEEKLIHQFRLHVPIATDVETGNAIGGLPQELRAQIDSAYVQTDKYVPALIGMFKVAGITTMSFDDILPLNRVPAMGDMRLDRPLEQRGKACPSGRPF